MQQTIWCRGCAGTTCWFSFLSVHLLQQWLSKPATFRTLRHLNRFNLLYRYWCHLSPSNLHVHLLLVLSGTSCKSFSMERSWIMKIVFSVLFSKRSVLCVGPQHPWCQARVAKETAWPAASPCSNVFISWWLEMTKGLSCLLVIADGTRLALTAHKRVSQKEEHAQRIDHAEKDLEW